MCLVRAGPCEMECGDRYWREGDHRRMPMVRILQLKLLSDSQSVIYLDAKVANCAFELRVTEENLDRSQVTCLVNLRCFGSPHGVGAIGISVKPDGRDPSVDNPGILPRGQMIRHLPTAWKQIAAAISPNEGEPRHERDLGLFGDLELHGPLRLLLDDGGSISDRTTGP